MSSDCASILETTFSGVPKELNKDGQEVLCALMLDEMSIRKHVQWDGKKYRGFVDLGTDIDDESLPKPLDCLLINAGIFSTSM